jgi:hypothetical protein
VWIPLGLPRTRNAKLSGETARKKSARIPWNPLRLCGIHLESTQIPVEYVEECKDLVVGGICAASFEARGRKMMLNTVDYLIGHSQKIRKYVQTMFRHASSRLI